MAKDVVNKLYLNPAIPKNSRLAQYLEQVSSESGTSKSQLLAILAAEYVRVVVDGGGGKTMAPALAAAPAVVTSPTAASSTEEKHEQQPTQGGIRTLTSMAATNDNINYDSVFGEPD